MHKAKNKLNHVDINTYLIHIVLLIDEGEEYLLSKNT